MNTNLVGANGITALYIANYGRAAEPAGLAYWLGELNKGVSFDAIAAKFAGEAETIARYPALADGDITSAEASSIVIQIYQNLFNRDPGANEIAYWSGWLAETNDSAGFIVTVLRSAQNADATALNNKVAVGNAYTAADALSDDYSYNINDARSVVDGVTSTQASVDAAENFIRDNVYPEGEVITVPGPIVTVPVPTPVFQDVHFSNSNGFLNLSSLKADGVSQQSGNGNFNTGFTINETRGSGVNDIQTGLNAHLRQASITDSYFKPENGLNVDGQHEIFVLKGQQLASNGSQSDNAGRAQTAHDIVINVDATGTTGKTFADYGIIRLSIDTDPTDLVNFATFEMDKTDPLNNFFLGTNGYAGGVTDGAVNAALNGDSVYSDSLNFAFIDIDPTTAGVQAIDFNALGNHVIKIEIYAADNTTLVHSHETLYKFVGIGDPNIEFIH